MENYIINIDEKQIQLINLIDTWLRDEMQSDKNDYTTIGIVANARVFLSGILEKGWYREGSEEQALLSDLRNDWIRNGGKWKAK